MLTEPRSCWLHLMMLALALSLGGVARAAPGPSAWVDAAKDEGTPEAMIRVRGRLTTTALGADPVVGSRAAFKLAELMEQAGEAGALTWYAHAVERDPGGRFAARARRRMAALSRRPEADQALLATLERLKREALTRGAEGTRAAVRALLPQARTEQARGELQLWLARDELEVRRAPEAALKQALAVVAGSEPPPVEQAYRAFYLGYRAAEISDPGALVEAMEAYLERGVPGAAEALSPLLHDARDLQRRRWAGVAGGAAVGLLALLFLLRRGWRAFSPTRLKAWRPWRGALIIIYLFGVGGWMAGLWTPGYRLPFWLCGAGLLPIHLLSGAMRWADPEAPAPWPMQMLITVAIIGSTLGVCFGVLSAFGRQALMGM